MATKSKAKVVKETKVVKEPIQEQKCTCCGETKKLTAANFYKSYSVVFKSSYEHRMCICKSCVLELAEQFRIRYGSIDKGLYELCRLLDCYYDDSICRGCIEQKSKLNNGNVFALYFQKINSLPQYKGKDFSYSSFIEREGSEENVDEEKGYNIIEFWGDGFTKLDYEFLAREFKNLIDKYECDSYAQEILFKEIAFQTLDIRTKRREGRDVSKDVKTLQDLLGSANIKPAQENASMSSEQVTFSTLIKKYENEDPIPEPLPNWMTSDWIRKYVVVWFLGNLCRMMGKPNPFQEEYDEEMDEYTVKPYDEED